METILIKNAKVIDSRSTWNLKTVDLLIVNGKIQKISETINDKADKIITHENLHVSPGFFDATVNFCDPGDEQKEDISSGIKAAIKGGFTAIGVTGLTNPPVTEKTRVEYIINKSKNTGVNLYPIGCISQKNQGKELAELYDMTQSGAKGFFDGKHQAEAGLISRALDYGRNFGTVIFSYPDEPSLSAGGLMHEGNENIKLGLKGIPAIAEELGVIRDSYLAEYHNARIHEVNISTAGSVEQLQKAKSSKIPITAQCSIHHLYFTDSDLHDFNSNLKIQPPLRSVKDKEALIKGLKTGIIDSVTSDHTPQDVEAKRLEFDLADFGASGLENTFSVLQTAAGKELGIEKIIEILAIRSRAIIGMEVPVIEVNSNCELALFDPEKKHTIKKEDLASRSYNNPYIGLELIGRIYGTINGNVINA